VIRSVSVAGAGQVMRPDTSADPVLDTVPPASIESGGTTKPANSNAPMSQWLPCGRAT
jgi:hypothetical protein